MALDNELGGGPADDDNHLGRHFLKKIDDKLADLQLDHLLADDEKERDDIQSRIEHWRTVRLRLQQLNIEDARFRSIEHITAWCDEHLPEYLHGNVAELLATKPPSNCPWSAGTGCQSPSQRLLSQAAASQIVPP